MILVNSRDLCQFLNADPSQRHIRQSTLRTWAARGRLTVHGKDGRYNLYDRDEVIRLAATRRKRSERDSGGQGRPRCSV